jgi:hypothetical protein
MDITLRDLTGHKANEPSHQIYWTLFISEHHWLDFRDYYSEEFESPPTVLKNKSDYVLFAEAF